MSSQKCRVMGRCKKEIRRCTCSKRGFLCPGCHPVNDKGYLVRKDSKPQYDGDSRPRPCHWKGKKSAYPKHNRRYHGAAGNGDDLIGFRKSDSEHIHKQCLRRLRGRTWSSWRNRRIGQQNYDVQYLEDEHNSQKEQITNLQKQLDDKNTAFQQLTDLKQSEMAQLKEEKNKLEKERQTLNAKNAVMNKELSGLKQQISKLEREKSKLLGDKTENKTEKQELRNEYERKIQKLIDKNAAINEKLIGSKQEQITNLQQQLHDKNNTFKQLDDANKAKSVTEKEELRKEYERKLNAINKELIGAKQENGCKQTEIAKLNEKNNELEKETAPILNKAKSSTEKQELRNDERKIQNSDAKNAAIKQELSGSKQEINDAKTENEQSGIEFNGEEENGFKQTEIAELKETNNELEKERQNVNDKNVTMNQEISKLKQFDDSKEMELENDLVPTENAKLKAVILNEAMDNQQNQKKELDDKNKAKSATEKQELTNGYERKLKIQNLNDKNAAKKQELTGSKQETNEAKTENLDYSLWREWDSKKVFYFIMNTVNDGSLKPYQESIKKEVFEAGYTGKDLADIEKADVKSMGIKKIGAKNAVYKAIQKLIQNKSQMNELPQTIKEFPQRRQLRTFNKYYMIFFSFFFLFFFIDTLYLRQFLNLSF